MGWQPHVTAGVQHSVPIEQGAQVEEHPLPEEEPLDPLDDPPLDEPEDDPPPDDDEEDDPPSDDPPPSLFSEPLSLASSDAEPASAPPLDEPDDDPLDDPPELAPPAVASGLGALAEAPSVPFPLIVQSLRSAGQPASAMGNASEASTRVRIVRTPPRFPLIRDRATCEPLSSWPSAP